MPCRHFLSLLDFSAEELRGIVARAEELRSMHSNGTLHEPLKGKVLGMIFDKSSTRTRVSFESAMIQMGGGTVFLSPGDSQLGRGEPVEDTARVLSRMVDAVAIRTYEHERIERFAAHSEVPVINALTDTFHPCQLLADVHTFTSLRGDIRGRHIAWVGDGNNVCHSYINAATRFDFQLRIACPEGFDPQPNLLGPGGDRVTLHRDPAEAVEGADLVVTDVWASMGQEEERAHRLQVFAPYRVTAELMASAKPDALFMHCLPAHRGEEVDAEIIDGAQSVVWDEAENRLHTQKSLLEVLLCP